MRFGTAIRVLDHNHVRVEALASERGQRKGRAARSDAALYPNYGG